MIVLWKCVGSKGLIESHMWGLSAMEKYQINSVLLAQACPAMVNHLSSTPSEVYPTLLYPRWFF